MLKQARDMQQRRLAGSGRRDEGHRLPGPQREPHAIEDGQRRLTLPVAPGNFMEIDNRNVVRWRGLGATHTLGPRRDRDAPRATTDKAWPETTASAPSARRRRS